MTDDSLNFWNLLYIYTALPHNFWALTYQHGEKQTILFW